MPGLPAPLRHAAATLAEALFPRRCSGCERTGSILCPACAATVPLVPTPQCGRCGRPLPAGAACPTCREFPLALDGIRSVYRYASPLKEALGRFKYVGARVAGADLGPLLTAHLAAHPLPVDGVAPVPLHPNRLRARGFNQAEALANGMAATAGLPLLLHAVERVRDTPPQARQPSRAHRHANMQAAFRADPAVVAGRSILLVDDVCTTGATLNAAAEALKAAGAAQVWALTLARAL